MAQGALVDKGRQLLVIEVQVIYQNNNPKHYRDHGTWWISNRVAVSQEQYRVLKIAESEHSEHNMQEPGYSRK